VESGFTGECNGAVEMCFGGFRRYNRYLNFTNHMVKERFSPRACAWAYGVNVFNLQAWKTERCTEQFHRYQKMVCNILSYYYFFMDEKQIVCVDYSLKF
jgi:Glycosyl transferase family 8